MNEQIIRDVGFYLFPRSQNDPLPGDWWGEQGTDLWNFEELLELVLSFIKLSREFCIKIKRHILHFTNVLCHHEYHSQRESTRILENPGLKQSSFHTAYTTCSGLKHSIMKYKEIALNRHLQMFHTLYRSGKCPKDKKVLSSWCGLASIEKKKKSQTLLNCFRNYPYTHPPQSYIIVILIHLTNQVT